VAAAGRETMTMAKVAGTVADVMYYVGFVQL